MAENSDLTDGSEWYRIRYYRGIHKFDRFGFSFSNIRRQQFEKTLDCPQHQAQSCDVVANSPTYTESTSGGATETITLGGNVAGNSTAAISGSKTTADV